MTLNYPLSFALLSWNGSCWLSVRLHFCFISDLHIDSQLQLTPLPATRKPLLFCSRSGTKNKGKLRILSWMPASQRNWTSYKKGEEILFLINGLHDLHIIASYFYLHFTQCPNFFGNGVVYWVKAFPLFPCIIPLIDYYYFFCSCIFILL